jgi:nucleotide-binding universal stress UspA family protein
MKEHESNPSGKGARLSLHVKPGAAAHAAAESPSELAIVGAELKLKQILVPVDFSESSDKALRYAAGFAQQFRSRITLLHVIQPMVYPADFGYPPTVVDTLDQAVRIQIEERLTALASQGPAKMETLVRLGQPYFEIVAAAKDLNADLIIISTHGRTGLTHALLGSTAERVVRHAPCPVLTVRQREHDFA